MTNRRLEIKLHYIKCELGDCPWWKAFDGWNTKIQICWTEQKLDEWLPMVGNLMCWSLHKWKGYEKYSYTVTHIGQHFPLVLTMSISTFVLSLCLILTVLSPGRWGLWRFSNHKLATTAGHPSNSSVVQHYFAHHLWLVMSGDKSSQSQATVLYVMESCLNHHLVIPM